MAPALLIEDNDDWLDWLKTDTRRVTGPGTQILIARNQKEAEELLQQHGGELSVVVLDLCLPRRAEVGMQLLRRIRAGEWHCPRVRVLCTSVTTASIAQVRAEVAKLDAVFVPRGDRHPRARFRDALNELLAAP